MWVNGVLYDLAAEPAWGVEWEVHVGGRNMTSAMRPYLIDIQTTDKEGTSSDSCNLTFDDRDGDIDLDIEGRELIVSINGAQAFEGFVETARSSGSRGGGGLVPVTAKGFDTRGKAKQQQAFHLDDAPLGDFLEKVAKNAGFELTIDDSLANIMRDYWSAEHESFIDIGEKIAREVAGTFKLRGKKAVLVTRGSTALPTIYGVIAPSGGNVISWDLAPFTGRPAFAKAEARWFDRKEAKFKSEQVEIGLPNADTDAVNVIRLPMGDKDQAKLRAEARKGEAKRDRGGGRVEIDIDPSAQAEALFVLSGARPSISGAWRIVSVGNRANRNGGSSTGLEVKEPGAE